MCLIVELKVFQNKRIYDQRTEEPIVNLPSSCVITHQVIPVGFGPYIHSYIPPAESS